MRVLMVSWEFPPHTIGGLGRHVADVAPALAAQGVDLHLITPLVGDAPATEQIVPHFTVHRVASPHIYTDAPLIAKVQHANADLEAAGRELQHAVGGFDLIHGHDWLAAWSSVELHRALERPLVVTIHSLERGRQQGYLGTDQSVAIDGVEEQLAGAADRIITVSRFMAQQLQHAFSLSPSTIDVIYNGVTAPTPPLCAAQRRDVRRRYANDDEHLVCFVGRLVYEKGAQTLLAALPQVHSQLPNIKVAIAGTGPMAEQLQQQAAASGLADRVVFAGYVSDEARNALYSVADVAVFPSLYEPFGIVALEAMSFGCPVVVSATGGLAEIVQPHETGIVAEPNNPASLAWGITHTLEHPKWAAARAANALRDLATTYNWQRVATQTIATYQRVLTAAHTAGDVPLAQGRRGQGLFFPCPSCGRATCARAAHTATHQRCGTSRRLCASVTHKVSVNLIKHGAAARCDR